MTRSFFSVMTSSNGNIFRVTGHLCWEFIGPWWIPAQKSVTRSFNVFFDLRLKKNGWVNNREAGDLKHYRAHYDVTVMLHHSQHTPNGLPMWAEAWGVYMEPLLLIWINFNSSTDK